MRESTTEVQDVIREVADGVYRSDAGLTAQREDGITPSGNPFSGCWVLRDASGAWMDMDQYRHDLFERYGLRW